MSSLSVIVPSYNEALTVPSVIEALLKLPLSLEIIVVDDGSTDDTPQALARFSNTPHVTLLKHPLNRGKGAAILTGLTHVSCDMFIVQDADLECDPNDICVLWDRFNQGDTDAVYGTRNTTRNPDAVPLYYWGGRLITLIAQLLYGTRLTDVPMGYKLMKTSQVRSFGLKCQGFDFCPEVTARLLKDGARIVEVPVSYHPRSVQEGKKLRASDGFKALWVLVRLRFKHY